MPLIKGAKARTRKGFSENVKREMDAGKPQKQAVAISYSAANEPKKPYREGRTTTNKKTAYNRGRNK